MVELPRGFAAEIALRPKLRPLTGSLLGFLAQFPEGKVRPRDKQFSAVRPRLVVMRAAIFYKGVMQKTKSIAVRIFCALVLTFASAASVHAQSGPGLDAVRVASGLNQPLFVTAPPGDFNRLFIVQQNGQVRILNLNTGLLNTTPFVTVGNIVTGGEQGLLGFAFDPSYATNGKFYVNCIAPGGVFNMGQSQIRQYQVSSSNPDLADTTPSTIKTMLTYDQPQGNHNGGWIAFSPRAGDDQNLYIASGDGGGANDQDGGVGHIEPGGNAQNTTTLLGKMLRIHVDPATGTYTIPSNNPFFGSSTNKQEIFAFGLRNPFRDSFDRATGRLFVGDVGQSTREEVDVQQATNPGGGENYGWRLREGFIATPTGNPVVGGARPPGNVDPIFDYPRSTGQTVIGGYVYRGQIYPALQGVYVFGDYLGPNTGGGAKIFTLNYNGTTASNFQDITSQLFPISTTSGNVVLANVSSFGEDTAGELYITDIGNGNVYKISPMFVSASSRKTHNITNFDINLPLSGTPGIECRSGGPNGDFIIVFRFAVPLSTVGGKSITAGTGSILHATIGAADPHEYVVSLTGVTNMQRLTLSLTNVTDVAGNTLASCSVTVGILLGDANGDTFVDSGDITLTKGQSGQPVTAANFHEDLNADGFIDSGDISLVKAASGTALPPSAAALSDETPPPRDSARSRKNQRANKR
jgi:glucose/arabinose dehydrogenase